MPVQKLFPTLVYSARLQGAGWPAFNARLLQECRQYSADDHAGQAWSATRYSGGYTSYGSLSRMQTLSPTFAALEKKLQRHVAAFSNSLEYDLAGRQLAMTDCWINIMPKGVTHGLHLHPVSTFSGTYYVRTPRGVPGLKLERPAPRSLYGRTTTPARLPPCNRAWVTMPVAAGTVLLFESWLRHEVPVNPVSAERISVSFNFNWF